jgi:hypothetical protein
LVALGHVDYYDVPASQVDDLGHDGDRWRAAVEGDVVDREQQRVGVRDPDNTTVLRHADDELAAVAVGEHTTSFANSILLSNDLLEVCVRVLPPEDPLAKLVRHHRGHRTSPRAAGTHPRHPPAPS